MVEEDFTIEEVDALTGPLIGLPNSASFRLLDIVGLDVWAFVGSNLYDAVPNDPWRDRFLPLDFEKKMIERKWLGDKTGQGFYKRVGKGDNKEIHALDWKTLEYHPAAKPRFPSVEAARNIEDLGERLRTLLRSDDRAGQFPVEGVQRSVPVLGRDDSRDLRPHRRNRSRHALGIREQAGAVRAVGRAWFRGRGHAAGGGTAARCPQNVKKALSRGAISLYQHADRQGQPADRRISISTRRATSPSKPRPASSCSRI